MIGNEMDATMARVFHKQQELLKKIDCLKPHLYLDDDAAAKVFAENPRHDADMSRFTDNVFVNVKDMTEEERIRQAYIAASNGDWGPGIALGLFPADASQK